MIYLACPFTHKHWWVRWWRILVVSRCASRIVLDGYEVFSPISHSGPMTLFMSKKSALDHNLWMKQDLPHLRYTKMVIVLSFNGAYLSSKGVREELKVAYQHFIPFNVVTVKDILSGRYAEMCNL